MDCGCFPMQCCFLDVYFGLLAALGAFMSGYGACMIELLISLLGQLPIIVRTKLESRLAMITFLLMDQQGVHTKKKSCAMMSTIITNLSSSQEFVNIKVWIFFRNRLMVQSKTWSTRRLCLLICSSQWLSWLSYWTDGSVSYAATLLCDHWALILYIHGKAHIIDAQT